jgi:hypothetical protein
MTEIIDAPGMTDLIPVPPAPFDTMQMAGSGQIPEILRKSGHIPAPATGHVARAIISEIQRDRTRIVQIIMRTELTGDKGVHLEIETRTPTRKTQGMNAAIQQAIRGNRLTVLETAEIP